MDMEQLGFKKVDDLSEISFNPYKKIGKEWFLVTAGDSKGYNTMTASWGFAGVMWGENTFTTVIRPQRYTKKFIDDNKLFTVAFFDDEYKTALSYCGSHSGKDVDKAKETGLTPVHFNYDCEKCGKSIEVTAFSQASMILVCKKTYVQPMTGEALLDKEKDEKWFADKDYHVQYIGEIVEAFVK